MVMNSTNHWTEVFYKELQDAEEYESSLAQAISPDKNRDALFLNPKETRLINRVESKQESNPIQKVKATIVQQKSVEETINCDFSVDSFPSDRSVKDTTKENRHATLGEKVSDRTKTPKQGKSSSTKIDEEQRINRAIPKQNVDIHLTKPRKEKLKERFEKGSSAKLSSQEMATKCTTAIQTSDFATNPPAPVAIEIFKEKAEYRVLSVSKSSPDKKAKPSAVYLASPTKKVHLNHQSNMIQDDVLCSKSKECHDPIKHNQSLGPLDEPMGTYDEYSCCTSNCSSVHVDTLLPVSNSCLPRHGSSMTSSTATFDANGIGRTVSDHRKNAIFSADHRLQSSIAKKSIGKKVENSCDQSIVSVLSEPTLHHEIECHGYYHPEKESLVDHARGILLDQEDASSFLSRLREKTSSPPHCSTTKISEEYLLPEDYSINTSFCDVLYYDAPIEDEISMVLTRECSVESWRSSKLLDEMKKNIERTRAALEDAKRIRKRE